MRKAIERLDTTLTAIVHSPHHTPQQTQEALQRLQRLIDITTALTELETDFYLLHMDVDPTDLRSVEEIINDYTA